MEVKKMIGTSEKTWGFTHINEIKKIVWLDEMPKDGE